MHSQLCSYFVRLQCTLFMPQTTVHMANVIPKIDNASPWGFS